MEKIYKETEIVIMSLQKYKDDENSAFKKIYNTQNVIQVEMIGDRHLVFEYLNVDTVDILTKMESISQVDKLTSNSQKQEQEHIEYSKKVQEQFSNDTKRIGELESKLIKQEKLLKLYQKYFNDYDDLSLEEETDIYTQIKELENE